MAKAWCLLIHADASLSLSHNISSTPSCMGVIVVCMKRNLTSDTTRESEIRCSYFDMIRDCTKTKCLIDTDKDTSYTTILLKRNSLKTHSQDDAQVKKHYPIALHITHPSPSLHAPPCPPFSVCHFILYTLNLKKQTSWRCVTWRAV